MLNLLVEIVTTKETNLAWGSGSTQAPSCGLKADIRTVLFLNGMNKAANSGSHEGFNLESHDWDVRIISPKRPPIQNVVPVRFLQILAM